MYIYIYRRGLGLAALNGHLYAVGGWDGKHNLASVESLSPATNTWRRVPQVHCGFKAPRLEG